LHPAPAGSLSRGILDRVDVLVPNLVELQQLSGMKELDGAAAEQAAQNLRGPRSVVVTLGGDGAIIVEGANAHHVAVSEAIAPVDTTGAGDAFCGALASALARGADLRSAVVFANRYASDTTTRPGALSSFVSTSDVSMRAD
jgi:ribokinase